MKNLFDKTSLLKLKKNCSLTSCVLCSSSFPALVQPSKWTAEMFPSGSRDGPAPFAFFACRQSQLHSFRGLVSPSSSQVFLLWSLPPASKIRSFAHRCDLRSREISKGVSFDVILVFHRWSETVDPAAVATFTFGVWSSFCCLFFDWRLGIREIERGRQRWVCRSQWWPLISTKGNSRAIVPIRGRRGGIFVLVWSLAIPLPSFALSRVIFLLQMFVDSCTIFFLCFDVLFLLYSFAFKGFLN